MLLKSFGCSFIFGTDLADSTTEPLPPKPSHNTWPALLAKDLGLSYQCHAHGGSGNLAIMDRVLKHIRADRPDFFVINWTYIDRFDYSDPNGGPTLTNDWLCLRPGSNNNLDGMYFRDLHSEYRDKLTSLTYIQTTITALQTAGCPFLMTFMDALMFDQRFHINPGIEYLQDLVRPHLHTFEGRDFLEWSRNKGHPISPTNHPLESAHLAAADYLRSMVPDSLREINKYPR